MARILIVEDEEPERIAFRDALRLRGHQVDVAADASEALQSEKKEHHDLAIIDFVLPGKRGLDVLKGLRRLNPFIRSIIISGKIDHDEADAPQIEEQLRSMVDADRYIEKPFSNEKLAETVDEVIGQSQTGNVDWKKVATDVVSARKVKAKHIKEMDTILQKKRKKKSR